MNKLLTTLALATALSACSSDVSMTCGKAEITWDGTSLLVTKEQKITEVVILKKNIELLQFRGYLEPSANGMSMKIPVDIDMKNLSINYTKFNRKFSCK